MIQNSSYLEKFGKIFISWDLRTACRKSLKWLYFLSFQIYLDS